MWNLPKPDLDASIADLDEIKDHSRSITDQHLPSIIQLYQLYDSQNGTVSELQHNSIDEEARKGLRNGYDKTSRNGVHSKIADEIKLGIDKCPMCAVGNASTLDHFMEKDKFKGLSMMRQNLVPMCYDCNTKRNHNSLDSNDFIHAYYDLLPEDRQWLKVKLTLTGGALQAFFYPDAAVLTDPKLFNKAVKTIDGLELNLTIGKQLHSFLSSTLGPAKSSDELLRMIIDSAAQNHIQNSCFGLNHWKTVLLLELKNSPNVKVSDLSVYLR